MTLTSASGPAAVDVATDGAVDVAVSLPAQPDSVPRARQYVRRHVPGLDGELRERAEQVVTELVGDLLPHHPDGRLLLRIAARGGTVRLVVHDGSGRSRQRTGAPGGAFAWRWALVVAMSDRHGVDAGDDGRGTTLWCELDAGGGPPAPQPAGGAPALAPPAAPAGRTPSPGLGALLGGAVTFEQACGAVLDHLRETVPMGFWAITRYDGHRQVSVHVRDEVYGTQPGDGHDWDASFCKRMLAGAPAIAPDAMAVPAYAGAGVSRLLPIGSYVAVPLLGADGRVFGTVCGLDPAVRDASLTRHAPLLQLVGTLLSALLQREQLAVRLHRAAGEARREAETDALTGLANRRGWQRLLDGAGQRWRDPVCVAVVDLDGLKRANDTLGHAAGDDLLRRTAEVLRAHLREQDVLARLGGDEFGVVLPAAPGPGAEEVVRQLRSALRARGIAASVGVGTRAPGGDLAEAWERADRAMYADKRRNRAGSAGGHRDLGAAS
ncbi:diguanylate cyclase domain-containing protein [Kineococcus arenarius]|uniref:diguanylate cyclase domain-containing protein n=1 Tax=Kineococcus sp. SYSU DK020 TaxID=3383141 RepID=UPI003D7E3937